MDSQTLTIIASLICGTGAASVFAVGWMARRFSLMFQSRITNRHIRQQLAQANGYRSQLKQVLKQTSSEAGRVRLVHLVSQIDKWADDIEALGQRVSGIQRDKYLRRDLKQLPSSIHNLKRKLELEENTAIHTRLSQTLENKQTQLATLQKLQSTMREAEAEIERMVSSLGIIYSQVVSGQSSSQMANYNHLSLEVDEQIQALHDYLEALEEVHLERVTRHNTFGINDN